ncbi:hypothetical protein [Spiroplasma endosymbiont of Polydrusus formosus]|uniref:hypothetical protein n=1 Tax=Spiroplasma endosymbiont of Polydrusus formosus TaxID=3139326 RepID=UPI0035B54445
MNIHASPFNLPGYVWFIIAFFVILEIIIGGVYLYNYCNNKIIKTKIYQTLRKIYINKKPSQRLHPKK